MAAVSGGLQAPTSSPASNRMALMDVDDATEGGVLVPIAEGPEDWAGRGPARRVDRPAGPVARRARSWSSRRCSTWSGLSDTLLTGRYLSEEHLAAVTVSTYLLWFLGSLMTIVSVGATALVARLTGARQPAAREPDLPAGGRAGPDPRDGDRWSSARSSRPG